MDLMRIYLLGFGCELKGRSEKPHFTRIGRKDKK
jgi:hypothetical protein